MTYSHACTRTAQFAGAAVLTTAIAATAVGPTAQGLENHNLKTAYHSVSVPLLALTAVESSIQLAASPSTAASQSRTAGAQAAVTANDTVSDFFYNAARTVAIAASFLTLPLWWIAFPITFPLGYSYGITTFGLPYAPESCGGYSGMFCGFRTLSHLMSAVFGPVVLVGQLLPPRFSDTTAGTSAAFTRRPTAAGAVNAAPQVRQAAITVRDNASRQASVNSASAKSKRSAKSAPAGSKSKVASAASQRRTAG